MEIEKMSDEELIKELSESILSEYFDIADKCKIELLKRLKKPEIWSYTNITPEQAVEEFKKKLVDKIYKLPTSFSDNGYDAIEVEEVEKIINNFNNVNMNEEIKRYLIRVKTYASKNSKLTLIKTEEIETDSASLMNLPPLDIFSSDTSMCVELEFIEERQYKKSGGMLVRI